MELRISHYANVSPRFLHSHLLISTHCVEVKCHNSNRKAATLFSLLVFCRTHLCVYGFHMPQSLLFVDPTFKIVSSILITILSVRCVTCVCVKPLLCYFFLSVFFMLTLLASPDWPVTVLPKSLSLCLMNCLASLTKLPR